MIKATNDQVTNFIFSRSNFFPSLFCAEFYKFGTLYLPQAKWWTETHEPIMP